MDKLDSTFKSVQAIRTPATGLMGYLAMLSQGDFEQEKIPEVVNNLIEEIPRIQSKVNEMRESVAKNDHSNVTTLVNKNGLELTSDLSKLEVLLKNDKNKPKNYRWTEELTTSQKIIRSIALIYDEFKKMGYVKVAEPVLNSKNEDTIKLKSDRPGKETVSSPEEVEKANEESEYKSFVPKELKRTHIEKYKTKESAFGYIVSLLLLLLLVGAFLLNWFFTKEFNIPFAVTIGIFELLVIGPVLLQEQWDKQLKRKYRLSEENSSYKMLEYEDEQYYTDYWWNIVAYRFGKFFYWIINASVLIGIAVLLFQRLGNVSIAPTTIIIILLIVIIYNQSKSQR